MLYEALGLMLNTSVRDRPELECSVAQHDATNCCVRKALSRTACAEPAMLPACSPPSSSRLHSQLATRMLSSAILLLRASASFERAPSSETSLRKASTSVETLSTRSS